MRILHTSDLHLNSKMDSRLGKAKAKERKRELILNFRKMTELAVAAGCEAFIIAGDLFDTEKISESVKRSAIDIIASAKELSFIYLPGNHEEDAISNESTLPENLFVFGNDWTYFKVGSTVFAGRRALSADMFKTISRPTDAEAFVAVLHGELRDGSSTDSQIGLKDLKETDIDYLALGHYHSYKAESFDEKRYAVYCGTPLGRGFDELGDKGFVLIDTNEKNVNFYFQKSEGRRLLEKKIDVTGVSSTHELCDKISHACHDIPRTDLLRALLIGKKRPEIKFDLSYIEERLKDSYYYFEVKDESGLLISSEEYVNDKSLKGEFIRLVLSDASLSEKEKEDIISTGILALLGESI